jgi:hypothetical protein
MISGPASGEVGMYFVWVDDLHRMMRPCGSDVRVQRVTGTLAFQRSCAAPRIHRCLHRLSLSHTLHHSLSPDDLAERPFLNSNPSRAILLQIPRLHLPAGREVLDSPLNNRIYRPLLFICRFPTLHQLVSTLKIVSTYSSLHDSLDAALRRNL